MGIVDMHLCVYLYSYSSLIACIFFHFVAVLLCCCCYTMEHSFVILLRATDWLNVYLFVVRAHHFVMIVVVAAAAARTCV